MPRFVIAFVTPTDHGRLLHRILESENKETALRSFFNESAKEFYSNDEQGYHYFKEDFFDDVSVGGNILEV